MQSPELEPLSDREKSPNSSNSGMQSDIIKKLKSKTSKKNNEDHLKKSLINPDEQTTSSEHQVIEINGNDDTNPTSATKLIDNDAADILINNSSDIKMSEMDNHHNMNGSEYDHYDAYLQQSCLQKLFSSFCSCYDKNKRVDIDFKGNNLICCNRHMMTGPLSSFTTVAFTVVLIALPLYGYYWITHKIWYQQQDNIAAYLIIMFISIPLTFSSFYFLFKTNFTDPGIIPRATREKPMFGPLNEYDRFCNTCYVIRPSKAKHCSICNNCVNGFDHHCPWVGTCVAARNLRYFVGFVGCTGLHAMVTGIVCLINLFVSKLKMATTIGLIDIILLIYCAIISCMLLGMSGDYFIMIGNGLTLNEKIKYGHRVITAAEQQREEREQRQQTRGSRFKNNLLRSFCYPLTPSEVFV